MSVLITGPTGAAVQFAKQPDKLRPPDSGHCHSRANIQFAWESALGGAGGPERLPSGGAGSAGVAARWQHEIGSFSDRYRLMVARDEHRRFSDEFL